jgi:hypothetical protein
MKRSWSTGLALVSVLVAALALNVGSASAGWAGISDIQYDNGGRNCTDGIEFSLTYFAALSISISITDDTDLANPVPVLPNTAVSPLFFQPVPELFGSGAYLASNSYRVLFPQPVAAGHHLDVRVTFGLQHASAGATVGDCTLGAPFTGFFGSVSNPPAINTPTKRKHDQPIKLKFGLGGDFGLAIFSEPPTANPIPCSFPAPGTTTTLVYSPTPLDGALRYDEKESRYIYTFAPDPNWTGCYEMWFRTTVDGLTHRVLFDFG